MLTAMIVYLQGSGGNIVARSLALDPDTVPFVPQNLAPEQHQLSMSTPHRLQLYNNWNSQDWAQTEHELKIWYHPGVTDFVAYEQSPLKLIDTFHPRAFLDESQKQQLWHSNTQWQQCVLIDWDPDDLPEIMLLARLKRRDMCHIEQIKQQELTAFAQVKQLPNFHCIHWKDMLQLDSYIFAIMQLANKLNLHLDTDAVRLLWTSWKQHTDIIKTLNE